MVGLETLISIEMKILKDDDFNQMKISFIYVESFTESVIPIDQQNILG